MFYDITDRITHNGAVVFLGRSYGKNISENTISTMIAEDEFIYECVNDVCQVVTVGSMLVLETLGTV